MRSVVVAFPASICAIMPILRVRSSGYSLAITFYRSCSLKPGAWDRPWLPAVMGNRLVGLGHLMHFFTALNRRALPRGRVHQLRCQALRHRLAFALTRIANQPAHCQRVAALA